MSFWRKYFNFDSRAMRLRSFFPDSYSIIKYLVRKTNWLSFQARKIDAFFLKFSIKFNQKSEGKAKTFSRLDNAFRKFFCQRTVWT